MEIAECFQSIITEHNINESDVLLSNAEKISFKKSNIIFTVVYLKDRKVPYFMQWEDSQGETWSINGGLESDEQVIEVIYMILENVK